MKHLRIISGLAVLLAGCMGNTDNKIEVKEKADDGYTPAAIRLESDIMTPEVLWSFGRLGNVAVSPDTRKAAYTVTYFDKEQDKSYNDLYLVSTDGTGQPVRITNSAAGKGALSWTPDGNYITFLSEGQLWRIRPDGSDIKKITEIPGGINGYIISPDSKKLLYFKDVKIEKDIHDLYPDLPKAKALLVENQVYRHWNNWVTAYSHPFVTAFSAEDVITDEGKDILQGEPWESPVRPFGGSEELAWTPESDGVIYTCRKAEGVDYFETTNTDLYLYSLKDGSTRNLTEGMMGYDMAPLISPDGTRMVWGSKERDGYESDKNRMMVMDLKTGRKRDYTIDIDRGVSSMAWSVDSKSIWFTSAWHGRDQIYNVSMETGRIETVTDGLYTYRSIFPLKDGNVLATRETMDKPSELYRVDVKSGKAQDITLINKDLLAQLSFGKVEEHWVKTVDNKKEQVWMIYPPHFDPSKKYPAILYCQGGPQSTIDQSWSYRWNMHMMAAGGYIIVAPNRRGLPGFGMEWLEQISGDHSGLNIQDYLSAIDYATTLPYVDKDNLGCVGASYGGYSVYYLAGCHQNRFKTFIAHCGIFDLEMMYYTTEEEWFSNWEYGGAPWEKGNKTAQRTFRNSPSAFIGNWDTPILVIHGQKDFRVDVSQGMAAFNCARIRKIPAQFLYFPDECHWVTRCQDGILWQRVFRDWLDRWLKEKK